MDVLVRFRKNLRLLIGNYREKKLLKPFFFILSSPLFRKIEDLEYLIVEMSLRKGGDQVFINTWKRVVPLNLST